jgi:hypothetical protein
MMRRDMSETGPIGWAFQLMPESGQRILRDRYEQSPTVRFVVIGVAIASQVAVLLATGLIGILLGSAFLRLVVS